MYGSSKISVVCRRGCWRLSSAREARAPHHRLSAPGYPHSPGAGAMSFQFWCELLAFALVVALAACGFPFRGPIFLQALSLALIALAAAVNLFGSLRLEAKPRTIPRWGFVASVIFTVVLHLIAVDRMVGTPEMSLQDQLPWLVSVLRATLVLPPVIIIQAIAISLNGIGRPRASNWPDTRPPGPHSKMSDGNDALHTQPLQGGQMGQLPSNT